VEKKYGGTIQATGDNIMQRKIDAICMPGK